MDIKKEEAIALSLVGNRFFFFLGQFLDEVGIASAMMDHRLNDLAES
ncbi:hypothetical protein [Pseudanabaena sp. 'Roaring Creek']|nr:hypothetical protein [Pseudanabaena sp. 'Roaring Creek']